MRGTGTLLVVAACVVAGLTGLASATLVSRFAPESGWSAPPDPVHAHPGPARIGDVPSPVAPLQAGLGLDRAAGRPDQAAPSASRISTATRHVRSPGEAAVSGQLHPATDRVMALLVGWILLASLGGGLVAPRH